MRICVIAATSFRTPETLSLSSGMIINGLRERKLTGLTANVKARHGPPPVRTQAACPGDRISIA